MSSDWRLILRAEPTGQRNMELDEALVAQVAAGASAPVARIYSWPCSSVSLGRHQEADALLDADRCEHSGIEVIRRPTGGTAIRHSVGDVTYSIITPVTQPPFSRDVLASYAVVNESLALGLGMLGIRASTRDPAPVWPETGVGFGCFESPGRHEVYWAGRKIVASAQRRTRGAILQHGTIPLAETGAALADLLLLEPGRRERYRRDLTDRTGTLARALDGVPTFKDVSHALSKAFLDGLAISSWTVD